MYILTDVSMDLVVNDVRKYTNITRPYLTACGPLQITVCAHFRCYRYVQMSTTLCLVLHVVTQCCDKMKEASKYIHRMT